MVLATSVSDAPELKSAISDENSSDSCLLLINARLGLTDMLVAPSFILFLVGMLPSEDDTEGEKPAPRAADSFEDADPA